MISPAVKVAVPSLGAAVALLEMALWQASASPGAWALENAAVICTIIAGVAGYGALRQRTNDTDKRIEKLEQLIESVTERKATRAEVAEHNGRVQHQLDQVLEALRELTRRVDSAFKRSP